MGWAYCGLDWYGRETGYGIIATCDKRGCDKEIDRGLGCICGDMHHAPWDDAPGCGRYYCGDHQGWTGPRGGCPHRNRWKAWGRTKCQLLVRDGKWQEDSSIYYCACREWEYAGLPPPPWDRKHEFEDPWLVNPTLVAGFAEHIEARGFACLGALHPNDYFDEVLTT